MKKLALIILSVYLLCGCGADCADEAACPLPEEQPAATATILPSPTPEATPEPTPEPTPSPTPKPLLPIEWADYSMPESVFGEANEQGWVEYLEYETQDYVSKDELPIIKGMDVYKPYNYDPEGQYDVLFLMHTSGADEGYWFRQDFWYPSPEGGYSGIYMFDMLDKMIEQGRCKPMIVISLDGYMNDDYRSIHNSAHSYEQFHHEFANDILPFVVENMATYAQGTSREELAAARDHFGFFGASYGSYLNNNCILGHCLDLVSHFGFGGGGRMDYDRLIGLWEDYGHESLPINCLYIAIGAYDDRYPPEISYLNFKADTERFNEENLYYSLLSGIHHEPREWINALYNSLQLFFR